MARKNKFFDFDLKNDSSNENSINKINTNKDYSNQIQLPDKKSNDTIDINNPFAKAFFIVLGLFCILGTAYYVLTWFFGK